MENITVIGIGKLGLGFALLFESVGYNVIGIDIFQDYVNKINEKSITFSEPGYNDLINNFKNFKASTNLEEGINFSNIIFIIVQTPNSGGEKFYDHSILSNLLCKINKLKPENKHIIIGCTVMPKYIDEVGLYLINDCKNCTLNYNPEFVAQGDIIYGFKNPDIILFGTEDNNLENKIKEIYSKIVKNNPKFCFLKPLEAEIVKISLNGFITTKISFSNMISDLCDTLNVRKEKVLDSIGSDSRIGNKYFRPGYSFGGPCFPRDTKALKQLMDINNINSNILSATTTYNEEHIIFQAKQMHEQKLDKYIIENICYKENSKIPIIEESAKLKIAKKLKEWNNKVIIQDNKELILEVKKEYGNLFEYNII